jgi:RNA polymerase I-specific transcription initiation factor RRN3
MSIEKHSENHFKRHSEEDVERDQSIKRRKVSKGNTNNTSNTSNTSNGNVFQSNIYRTYIKAALDALDDNNPAQIDTLASQISLAKTSSEALTTENFTIILSILTNNISKLDNKLANNLIFSILKFKSWWALPDVSTYQRFIMTLCSYLPKWWNEVASILIQQFTHSTIKTNCHHELMQYFLSIIPTSTQYIHDTLIKTFPNKNNSKNELVNYVSNLLIVEGYSIELRKGIWRVIIERCIGIDVELQNELDELDDAVLESEYDTSSDSEEEDSDSDVEEEEADREDDKSGKKRKVHFSEAGAEESDEEIDSDEDFPDGDEEVNINEIQIANIADLSDKLDSILSIVIRNLQQTIHSSKTDAEFEEKPVEIFNIFTSLFKSHILPTYYTKSTQFIMFYFTQQLPELADSFLVSLIDVSFSSHESIEKRIKSLQYLSSYLSRARSLQKTQIVYVLGYLMSWLNRYIEQREVEINGVVNMDRFKLFYSTFQVLLYVFCFRHEDLKNDELEEGWELNLPQFFQRMLITKFNPLKYCNENVVSMFAKIAQEENVAYCFSVIQKNRNERLKGISGIRSAADLSKNTQNTSVTSSHSASAKQQFIDLEGYFPFDPLFLKQTKSLLKEFYVEWKNTDYQSDTEEDLDLGQSAQAEITRRNSNM